MDLGSTVVGPEATDVAIWSEAETLLARLGGHAASLENLELVEGELDWVFENHPAVVIRPDRYIFGVVDHDWSLDDLLLELGKKLPLR